MIIYLITNIVNNKQYIGQTTRSFEQRIKEHTKNGMTEIDKDIKIYGVENFKFEIIEECSTIEQLNEREKFWILKFNCRKPFGYNVMPGGNNGHQINMRKEPRKYRRTNIRLKEFEASIKVKELENEIRNLQKALMMAQSEIIKSQKETLALKDMLIESERKSLEAVSSSSILNAKLEESNRRESAANEQIRELKNRSLLERILNR